MTDFQTICGRMLCVLALAVLPPSFASAQTANPVKTTLGSDPDSKPAPLEDGTIPPEPVGRHICPGYPQLAAKNLKSGKTELSMTITDRGAVSEVKVEQSSGDSQLDSAAVLCVKGWLYKPATRDGSPVAFMTKTEINWFFEGGEDEPDDKSPAKTSTVTAPVWKRGGFNCVRWYVGSSLPPHAAVMTFFVEADGSVSGVKVIQSSGRPDIDKDAVKCLSRRSYKPAKQDGKPIRVHISDWLY